MVFKIIKKNKNFQARLGELKTNRAILKTPFFMPIATKGAVKSLTYEDLNNLQTDIILSNTYHLMLRPGNKLIKKAGGLHRFMNWNKAILTDSGGFQVFSLGKIRKITQEGVEFRSHLDGSKKILSPENSIQIQLDLGSDIIMVFDECVALPSTKEYLTKSVDLTLEWAKRCKKFFDHKKKKLNYKPLIFAINQGGLEKDLRIKSARDLMKINFDGYAIGGLSVGESAKQMYEVLDWLVNEFPVDKPRYLMGVGKPENIIEAVKRGVDMFDCVIPTREARHGRLYLWNKKVKNIFNNPKKCYTQINVKSAKFMTDFSPINNESKFAILKTYSKAYLRHLFNTQEPLAIRLATLNNLEFYLKLMNKLRKQI